MSHKGPKPDETYHGDGIDFGGCLAALIWWPVIFTALALLLLALAGVVS